ncbi:DUF7446 family protein [Serratia fonticola]
MSNPITVGYSPITGNIYAGRSKPLKGSDSVRQFTADKFDVTEQALIMVAHKLKDSGEPVRWKLADGSILTLTATVDAQEEAKL